MGKDVVVEYRRYIFRLYQGRCKGRLYGVAVAILHNEWNLFAALNCRIVVRRIKPHFFISFLGKLVGKERSCTQSLFCYHRVVLVGYTPLSSIRCVSCEVYPSVFSWNLHAVAVGIFSYSFLHILLYVLCLHVIAVDAVEQGSQVHVAHK